MPGILAEMHYSISLHDLQGIYLVLPILLTGSTKLSIQQALEKKEKGVYLNVLIRGRDNDSLPAQVS